MELLNGRHLDDNSLNNSLSNLQWGTPRQNSDDALRNGKIKSRHGVCKLTVAQISRACAIYSQGTASINSLAKEYGVASATLTKAMDRHKGQHHRMVLRGGILHGVYSDTLLPLYKALGIVTVKRASQVEFDHDSGDWVARLETDGTEIARGTTRSEVIAAEVKYLEERL